jgi:hypothetical protein
VDWSFGTFLWSMVVFFFWFAVIWMFIGILGDILRRDMSGWGKAGWIVLIVVLPFLGALIYLIARPRDTGDRFTPAFESPAGRPAGYRPADEIATAARLHDEGKLTADEYEQLKANALRY